MFRILRYVGVTVVYLGFAAGRCPAQNGVPISVISTISRSVVLVSVTNCVGQSPDRTGTGFLWRSGSQLVTAYHVVAGCARQNVLVHSAAGAIVHVRAIRADRSDDLALLQLASAAGSSALTLSTSTAAGALAAVGFPWGEHAAQSVDLTVRFVRGGQLQDVLPSADAARLMGMGWPSLTAQVLNLEGHLVPGLSGSPVFDEAGRVVGIADGGLKNGFVAMSWATPAAALSRLATAPPMTSNDTTDPDIMFDYDAPPQSPLSLKCGAAIFDRIGRDTYLRLERDTDDPNGLGVLTSMLHPDIDHEVFDVYQERHSGAGLVLPVGAVLHSSGAVCTATVPETRVVFTVKVTTANSLQDVQSQTVAMGSEMLPLAQGWRADPNYSYATALPRADGMIRRRIMSEKCLDCSAMPMTWSGSAFLTYAWMKPTLMSVFVVDPEITSQLQTVVVPCLISDTTNAQCSKDLPLWYRWGEVVHAVALATFPQYGD